MIKWEKSGPSLGQGPLIWPYLLGWQYPEDYYSVEQWPLCSKPALLTTEFPLAQQAGLACKPVGPAFPSELISCLHLKSKLKSWAWHTQGAADPPALANYPVQTRPLHHHPGHCLWAPSQASRNDDPVGHTMHVVRARGDQVNCSQVNRH